MQNLDRYLSLALKSDGKIIDLGQKVDEGMSYVKDAVQDVAEGAENLKDDLVGSFSKNNDQN